jgi:hypothetical protein
LAVLALILAVTSARAAGTAFTDARWVSLPGADAAIYSVVPDTNGNLHADGAFINVGSVAANSPLSRLSPAAGLIWRQQERGSSRPMA